MNSALIIRFDDGVLEALETHERAVIRHTVAIEKFLAANGDAAIAPAELTEEGRSVVAKFHISKLDGCEDYFAWAYHDTGGITVLGGHKTLAKAMRSLAEELNNRADELETTT